MTSAAFVRPVEAASVVERVTHEIRRSIVAGRMEPGQEFSLRQIAAQLGVSFIPVREALRSLEAEGLLVTRRGRSAVVAPLDAEELRAIRRLRRLIEPDLNIQAAEKMPAAELDRLEAFLELCADPGNHPDVRYERYHTLHLDLVRPAATAWDLRIIERLWRAFERYVRMGEQRADPGEVEGVERGSAELIAAFRARDPERVREATLRRLEHAERIARRSLDS
jgi:DNA-binding GntR family transcriptional regulator